MGGYSLNKYYSGKNKNQRAEDARFWHKFVAASLYQQKIPKKLFENPEKISFWWDDRLDIDNHAVIGKMIVDSLKGWCLRNDNRRWFEAVAHSFWNGGRIKVEVEEL